MKKLKVVVEKDGAGIKDYKPSGNSLIPLSIQYIKANGETTNDGQDKNGGKFCG